MAMNRSAEKELIRKGLLEERRKMPFEEVFALSSRVQRQLLASALFRDSKRVSLYSSFGNEVLTDDLFRQAMDSGKEVFYPRAARDGSRTLKFLRVTSLDDLSPGAYDIPEPVTGEFAEPATFDLIVVPGVAFDPKGGRLGFGMGYYDKALADARCPVAALAYEFQVLKEEIPIEPHDVRVSAIATERRLIRVEGA